MNSITFEYRGWHIEVSPDESGWVAKAKHPQMQSGCVVTTPFNLACDAIQAAINYVTWTAPDSAINCWLRELKDTGKLSQRELNRLRSSFSQGLRTLLPLRSEG